MATEKRLIDANAVKKNKFYLSRPTLDKEAVNEVLANCPIVDAVEVVHGRWESTRFGDIRIATLLCLWSKARFIH